MYRLNYGNGQVSERRATLREASREYYDQIDYSARIGQSVGQDFRIQKEIDSGEWYKVAPLSREDLSKAECRARHSK